MDLTQNKLSRAEWDSIEIPVNENERKILNVIMNGYGQVNIRDNDNESMLQMLRIVPSNEMHSYFYREYFEKEISAIHTLLLSQKQKKNAVPSQIPDLLQEWKTAEQATLSAAKNMKKADLIRVQNMASSVQTYKSSIYEYVLIDFCSNVLLSLAKNTTDYGFYLYTLIRIKQNSIPNVNIHVLHFVEWIIQLGIQKTNIREVFHNANLFIEKNKYIFKYQDTTLYDHQKQLFSLFKNNATTPRLVLYSAPTGTGKTMSPLGLASEYKIVFVCVARHVGLALAKSAISLGKKVAFAFGCETASDIRLHYFSAVNYTVNKRSGGIGKVDNSIGTNVEIMICDVKSYLTAMHYMLAFNSDSQLITYWDEPTITMDYPSHPLHETIQRNWSENRISKMVLSCATLPKEREIEEVIIDFRMKFENAEINNITSFDCKKSITLLNKDGYCVLPHLLFNDYTDMQRCVIHCYENNNLLRYLDLEEIIRFIEYVDTNNYTVAPYTIDTYFESIQMITMDSIKMLYLEILKRIDPTIYPIIHIHMITHATEKYKTRDNGSGSSIRKIKSVSVIGAATAAISAVATGETLVSGDPLVRLHSHQVSSKPASNPAKGIQITTADAHTLTDGPTIFLAEDVEKIGKFCVQQSKIPDNIFSEIMQKIEENEVVQKKMEKIEKELEDTMASKGVDETKEKKMERATTHDKPIQQLNTMLDNLRQNIRVVRLESKYVPNTKPHQAIWSSEIVENAFVPDIDDITVKNIMALNVENGIKMLLLLGIGTFTNEPNVQYMEIMKELATQQKLYLVIAQSDYIYGTNYQFCHGFISKDLTNMTQQKTIQAMGRIGRNNIQQDYTVRFRDDSVLTRLFLPMDENMEAINMCKLFTTV
jgi:hypothetical protein